MPRLKELTNRENQVALLIVKGYTNSEIAKKLKITKFTIETHRKRLMHKVKAKNLAELVKLIATGKVSINVGKNLTRFEKQELNKLRRENKRLMKIIKQMKANLNKKVK